MWVQKPSEVPGCIQGLEYLLYVDTLVMTQIPCVIEGISDDCQISRIFCIIRIIKDINILLNN